MKILVAMSGGVDSSVAAHLLLKQGHEVAGITMMLGYRSSDGSLVRIGESAVTDAARVCAHLGIEHIVEDFTQFFDDIVVADFTAEYQRGRTPNPCVICNKKLKFGRIVEIMHAKGFEKLATGHYAGIGSLAGDPCIMKNSDPVKDQSYFLYAIPREVLPHLLFPLNLFSKPEIRAIAVQAGIPVAHKKDSQDICFIMDDYRDFIRKRIRDIPRGNFVTRDGKLLGHHEGIPFYTIGQRRGLGVSAPAPLYVVAFDLKRNDVILGYREELTASGLFASQLNFFTDMIPTPLAAKIRYAQREFPCHATISVGRLRVLFDEPQESVTPGQSVVLYHRNLVIGGGIIEEAIP